MAFSGLQTFHDREVSLLAPCAMFSMHSRGRKYAESEHPYRGPFQRDRDRIVHSAAYRRLSGKMQVFTGDMGDYHRTRLTHTHEVASIARTIGRALRLNEDLIEALALFHDIGHPPFGHAGEDALNECLVDDGGFSHNAHALTIVEELERRYHQFPGLNLTFEVLEGQSTRVNKDSPSARLLEVQVVDAADGTAYNAHDSDDAVKLGLVTLAELFQIEFVRECRDRIRSEFTLLDDDLLRKAVVHEMIDRQVSDILRTCGEELTSAQFVNADHARESNFRIGPSSQLAAQHQELASFLYERVYRHDQLISVRNEAQQRLHAMFEGYVNQPDLIPAKFRQRAEQVGVGRSVGEYLAGMTDRYCDDQFHKDFECSSRG